MDGLRIKRIGAADAARGGMCIECTTSPREQNSTRCGSCLERARDSMRIKRAAEAQPSRRSPV
jgi:hypothetical protein